MIKFYYNPSPNPAKVALLLEETGFAYEVVPVDPRKGEQFTSEYLAINPNSKIPAIVDTETDATIFDSNAILLYLAHKANRFLPVNSPVANGQLLSWLMFVATGVGPFSGQAFHFSYFAPEPKEYAVNRYLYEVERHWRVVDTHLSDSAYMAGNDYTIADMALWGWAQPLHLILGEKIWEQFPNAKRLFDLINARPAADRANALASRYDFKEEMDKEAQAHMFPQNRPRPS